MDPALKQRLIGAAVLVALAVIFLPMLIGRPAPAPAAGSDVPLDIPAAPDRSMQTREIPLTLPPAGTAPIPPDATADAAQDDDPDRVVAVDLATAPRIDALDPPAAAGDGDATPAASAVTSTSAQEAVVETTSMPAAATPTPGATPPPPTPPASAPESAAPAAMPVAAAVSGTRYVVTLGTYANRDNAAALATRLRDAGLPVLSESLTLDGKPATRVRLGPYAGRGDAEAARLAATRLQSDLPAAVVVLADSETTPPVRAPTVGTGFAVQLGALKDEAEANALRDRVRKAGFAGYTERTQTDAGTLWRVRAGPELNRERAERLRDDLRGKLALDGLVVGHP